ncbi:MAG: TIGR00269 family protein [Archaeoglobaceae archaeon]|nr:TIGR00269 family protein [Archaeoglobaceae archaeon]MDW8118585.1 TIGR00269 family protein [Archaeoglobaceae archaeon]
MKCSYCNREAVYYQRYSGKHLCRKHFTDFFEKKIRTVVKKYKMIETGDRIAIALSGGKDSTTLTKVLLEIYGDRRDLEFLAITIDEGIEGYREETLKIAKEVTRSVGIEHYIARFEDNFSAKLDEIVKIGEKLPCSYCGVFRKYLLNKSARELSANKLATAHNLDDESQTILMNFINADIDRLARLIPQKDQEGLIRRVKPFMELYEKEIVIYGFLKGYPMTFDECPYSYYPVRAVVRDFIYEFERKYPGRKISILRSLEKLSECLKMTNPQIELNSCKICGEPTSQDLCQACKLINELKGKISIRHNDELLLIKS